MCIEKEIAANTAAVNALTAAVRQLLEALPARLSGAAGYSDEDVEVLLSCASAPAQVKPRAPAPVAPAPAPAPAASAPAQVKPRAPAPVAPAPAPAPAASAPAPVAPAPAPVAPAPAPVAPAPAPVNPAPAPVTPAPAPAASAPAQDGMWYPGGGEVPETPLTLADVRSVCVRAGQAGYTQAVVDFLTSRGVKLLTELPPAQYPALLMMLAEKGVR